MAPVPVQPGSLIIPMDSAFQDAGMFQAYGLVYFLLQRGIPVIWSIAPDKPWGGPDFTASAVDIQSLAPIIDQAYRGGPFIISADDAAAAEPLIQAWQAGHTTTVHRVTALFIAPAYALLRHVPRIAVGQSSAAIVSGYLNAASIPDSAGNPWSLSSPDVLSPAEIAAGVLFANPTQACRRRAYDVFLAPQTSANPAVVANLDEWVRLGGYLHGTCFPVSTTENLFHFLTAAGIPGPFNQGVPGTFTINVADFGLTQALDTTDLQDLPTGGSDKSWRRGTVSYLPYVQPMAHFHAESGPQYDFMAFGPYKGGTGAGSVSYEGGCEYDTSLPYSSNTEAPYLRFVYNAILLSAARPQLAVSFSPEEAAVGYPTTFTVTIRNGYGQTAGGLSVAVTPAPGVTWADNETLPPTIPGPPTWTWVLPAFATEEAFSFQLTATPAAPGQLPLFTIDARYDAPEGAHYQLQTCAGVTARFDLPPTVTITAPLTGDFVSGLTTVTWTGSDPDGDPLTYDLFFSPDGGATWSTLATGLAGNTFSWDTDSINTTNAHIRVVASDGLLTGEDEEGPFTVDNTLPTVQILTPAENSIICGKVVLTAEVFDAVGVASVSYSFSIDGGMTWQAIGTTTGGPPWSVLFDTEFFLLAYGSLLLRATATDLAGLTGERTIFLYVDNWPPEAVITAPPDGSLLSGSVLLQGTASDLLGLDRVEWRIDGALVATQTAAPFQYLWNTTLAAYGPHAVTLTAIDRCPNITVATSHYTVENGAAECLTEVGVDGEILIPSGKPPAERLLEPVVWVGVTSASVIDTPLGGKAVVTGVVRLLLRYVAALPEQPVHAVEREIAWRTFLLCPGIEPGTEITATVAIESAHFSLLDPRRIDKFLLLLVRVAPA